jgi:hypothetical protein
MSVPSFDLTLTTELFGDGLGEISVSAVAAAALQRRAIAAIVNPWRVIAARSYHFVIVVWRAKEARPPSDSVRTRNAGQFTIPEERRNV